MTTKRQIQIANAFPQLFEEFEVGLTISEEEFILLLSEDRVGKFDFFIIGDIMYWSRGPCCIFKIEIKRSKETVTLSKALVNRDRSQYGGRSAKSDRIYLLKLIQARLNRVDIYVDPEFEYDKIKEVISKYDPENKLKKFIRINCDIGFIKRLHKDLFKMYPKDLWQINGWDKLEQNILAMNENTEILILEINDEGDNKNIMYSFYFDSEAKELLGQVTTKRLK